MHHGAKNAAHSLITAILLLAVLLGTPVSGTAGSIVTAQCPCGFSVENLHIFGGKGNFETVCMFPALCLSDSRFLLVNIYDLAAQQYDCPLRDVVLYTSPELMSADMGRVLVSWNLQRLGKSLELHEGGYKCPECKEFALHFHEVGKWD